MKALVISACAPDASTESQTGTTNWVLRLTQLLARLHDVTLITIPPIRDKWLLKSDLKILEFSPQPFRSQLVRIVASIHRGIYPSMWLHYSPRISEYLKSIPHGGYDVCWVLEDYGGMYIRDIPRFLPVAFHRSYVLGMQASFTPQSTTLTGKLKGLYRQYTAKAFDRWTSARANLVLTGTQDSCRFIQDNYPHNRIKYCPVKPCYRPQATSLENLVVPQGPEGRLVAVFLADMGFIRNAEGAQWFIQEVLPLMPEPLRLKYHFKFIGRKPDPVPELGGLPTGCSVEFSGFVDDLNGALQNAQLSFIPVFGGNGVRIKTVTLLGTGLPTVSTPDALEGLYIRNGVHAIVATSSEEFIAGFETLLDANIRAKLHKSALQVMDNFLNEDNDAEDLLQLSKILEAGR